MANNKNVIIFSFHTYLLTYLLTFLLSYLQFLLSAEWSEA